MTFAEPVWRYKSALTFSRTSPVSPLDMQVLAGRLGRNRRKRAAGEQRWRRMEETGEINVCFMTLTSGLIYPGDHIHQTLLSFSAAPHATRVPCESAWISTFPTSQEPICSILDLWAAAQLHSWRWDMCSPAQREKSKHKTSDT